MNVKKLFLISGLVFTLLLACKTEEDKNIAYIDPMIGTDTNGHTFPSATVPFGMVQLSPSNGWKGWDWCFGYHYRDFIVKGFAHNHISGAGLVGLGYILLISTYGKLQVAAGTEGNSDSG